MHIVTKRVEKPIMLRFFLQTNHTYLAKKCCGIGCEKVIQKVEIYALLSTNPEDLLHVRGSSSTWREVGQKIHSCKDIYIPYRAFSLDVTAVILVFQKNETVAMLVLQTNLVGVKLFSFVNAFFCSNKFV